MSNVSKAIKLRKAMELLNEADCLMQEALGNTEQCFDLHCGIENIADELNECAEQLIEMQVTE